MNTTRMQSPRIHISLPNGDSSVASTSASVIDSQQAVLLTRIIAKLDAVHTVFAQVRTGITAVECMLKDLRLLMEQSTQQPHAESADMDKGKNGDLSSQQHETSTSLADDKQKTRKPKKKQWRNKRKSSIIDNVDKDTPEPSGKDFKNVLGALESHAQPDENVANHASDGASKEPVPSQEGVNAKADGEGSQRPVRRFFYNQKAKSISYSLVKSSPRRDVLCRDADVVRRATNILQAFIMGHSRRSAPWQKIIFVTRHRMISKRILTIAEENDMTAEELLQDRVLERIERHQKAESQLLIGTPDQILNAYEKRYFLVETVKVLCFEDAQAFCTHQGGDAFKVLERIGRRSMNRRPTTMRIYGLDRDETGNFAMNADNGLVLHDRRTFTFEVTRGPEARANFLLELSESDRKFRALVQLLMDKDNELHLQDKRIAIFTSTAQQAQDLALDLEKELVIRDVHRTITVLTTDADVFGDIIIATDPMAFILRYHPVDAVVNLCLPEPLFPGRSIDVAFRERTYCARLGDWRSGYGLAVSICNNQEAATLNLTAKHSRLSLQPLKLHLKDSEAVDTHQQAASEDLITDSAGGHSSIDSSSSDHAVSGGMNAIANHDDQERPAEEDEGNDSMLHGDHTSFASADSVDIVQNMPAEIRPESKLASDPEMQIQGSSVTAIEATGPPRIFVGYQPKSLHAAPIKRNVDARDEVELVPNAKKPKPDEEPSAEGHADKMREGAVRDANIETSQAKIQGDSQSASVAVRLPEAGGSSIDRRLTIDEHRSASAVDNDTEHIPESTDLSASFAQAERNIAKSTISQSPNNDEVDKRIEQPQNGEVSEDTETETGKKTSHLPTPDVSREEDSALPSFPQATTVEDHVLSRAATPTQPDAQDVNSEALSKTAAKPTHVNEELNSPVKPEERGGMCTSH